MKGESFRLVLCWSKVQTLDPVLQIVTEAWKLAAITFSPSLTWAHVKDAWVGVKPRVHNDRHEERKRRKERENKLNHQNIFLPSNFWN